MEQHKHRVSRLCRVCGKYIEQPFEEIKQSQDKRNFVAEIKTLYDTDVRKEDMSMFPRFVCMSHVAMLYKFRKSQQENTKFQHSVTKLKDFMPHEPNCEVCKGSIPRKKVGRPANKRKRISSAHEPRTLIPDQEDTQMETQGRHRYQFSKCK